MKLKDYQEYITNLHNQAFIGCGNHGCVIKRPIGMGTNGGCKCSKYSIARMLKRIATAMESSSNDWE